mgnify:CR=1 FL=1
MIFTNLGYSQDCTYNIEEYSFNEDILAYYLVSFDGNSPQSQLDIFCYEIKPLENPCDETLKIEFTLQIYAPEIGLTRYEIFYQGIANIEVDSGVQYFRYSDFTFLPQQTVANNAQAEKLISYISQLIPLTCILVNIKKCSHSRTIIWT